VLIFGVLGMMVAALSLPTAKGSVAPNSLLVLITGAVIGALLGALIIVGRNWAPRRSPRTPTTAPAKAVAPEAVSPRPKTERLAPGVLVEGRTAWSARRLGFLSPSLKMLLAEAVGALAVLSTLSHWNPLIAQICWPLAVVIAVFTLVASSLERQATKRERAAGYTTLNGRELDLEQRHPHTGQVIRKANAKAIPTEKFNELLAAD
jgi:hypothetical protein